MLSLSRWEKKNEFPFVAEGIVLSQLQTEIHFRSSTTKLPTGNYLTFLVNSLGVTRTFISRAIKDTPLTFNNHPDCFFPGVLRTHTNVGRDVALPEVRLIEGSDFTWDPSTEWRKSSRQLDRERDVNYFVIRTFLLFVYLATKVYVLCATKYEASKRSIMKVDKVHPDQKLALTP